MPVKLTTSEQLELLKEGDILQRFPSHGKPESRFDITRNVDIDTFEIKSINRKEQILRLSINENQEIFSWPADVERLNIKSSSLLAESRWWIPD